MTDSDPETISHEDARAVGPFQSLQIVKPVGAGHFARELAGTAAEVSLGSGHVIQHIRVANVYVNAAGPSADSPDFDVFSKAAIEDGYLDMLQPYGAGRGTFLGGFRLNITPSSPGVINDETLQAALHAAIADGSLPAPDASTSYHFIFPDGLAHTWQGNQGTCGSPQIAYCGIHLVSSQGILYTVVGSPSCYGCHGEFRPRQLRMSTWTHELVEEITNPYGDAVWDRESGEEVGDLCIAWPDPNLPSAGPENLVPYGPPEKDWWVQREWIIGQGCQVSSYVQPQPQPDPKPVKPDPDPASYQSRVWTWMGDMSRWAVDKTEAARKVQAAVVLQILERAYPSNAANVTHELESAPKPPTD